MLRPLVAAVCLSATVPLFCPCLDVPAWGASKVPLAALGLAAPGDGLFVGPSFIGQPSAAGNGWVAFRAQVAESGSVREQIEVINESAGGNAGGNVVASLGDTVPDVGRFQQFLGRPTVNSRGDVVFAALVRPVSGSTIPTVPPPGGVFLYSQGTISVVAMPGFETGFGILDFSTPIGFGDDVDSSDVAERTPALNDVGDIAFVASTLDVNNGREHAGLFVRRAGSSDLVTLIRQGDAYQDGRFDILGPPALNNSGTLAFHATVSGSTSLDGIWKLEPGAQPSLLLREGVILDTLVKPRPFDIDPIAEFDDVVVLNDAGDVACTGGPLFDNSLSANLNDIEGSPGVILIHDGTPLLVAFPGQPLLVGDVRRAKVSDLTLGPEGGSRVAPPSLMPDGDVVFFAQVNGGGGQEILRAELTTGTIQRLVGVGGTSGEAAPVDGTYQAASSAPAIDGNGGLTFSARIQGGTTSEAMVYVPPTGPPQAIVIGDAVPEDKGVFGGPPFFPPQMNNAGDIVFKSYVAKGPAGLAIFRYHQGTLERLVRTGDPAPGDPPSPFLNLLGNPSINKSGDVAFTATIAGARGIFLWSGGTLRTVAMTGVDFKFQPDDLLRKGSSFRSIAPNPFLSDSGRIAFRATLQYQDPFDPLFNPDVKHDSIMMADDAGFHVVAEEGDHSGVVAQEGEEDAGQPVPFFRFRDPVIHEDGSVVVRASLGQFEGLYAGMFLFDGPPTLPPAAPNPIAVEGRDLNGMALESLLGRAVFDQAKNIVFPVRIGLPGNAEAGLILRRSQAGALETIARTGDPGPEGGLIRSLGRPNVAPNGDIAFRIGFEPFQGGVAGLFLKKTGVPTTYLRIGEGAGIGPNSRITSFNQNVALNDSGTVAMLAAVGGVEERSAILMVQPTTLNVRQLAWRRGPALLNQQSKHPKPKDQVKFSAVLTPANPRRLDKKATLTPLPIAVAVSDMKGTLWSATIGASNVKVKGHTMLAKTGPEARTLRALRIRVQRDGTFKVAASSLLFDISSAALSAFRQNDSSTGAPILEPPFSVRVDVGPDGGSIAVQCKPKGKQYRCVR